MFSMDKVKKIFFKFLRYTAVIFIAALIVIPFLWMIFSSFKTDSEILTQPFRLPATLNFENYYRAFTTLDMPLFFKNTFIIASVSLFFGIVITFMSSFALSMIKFKFSKGLYFFFISGLAIPIFILLFPVFFISAKLEIINTYISLILPYIAISIPFNTLLFTGFLREFPREIIDAAIMDGCGLFALCTRIILPIIKPVTITIFIFNLLYVWNEFPLAVTLIGKRNLFTIALSAALFKGRWDVDFSGIMAAGIIIIIPQLIVFAFLQRYVIEGMTAGAVKG